MIEPVVNDRLLDSSQYTIRVETDERRTIAVRWLWLSVMALAVAGVFSLLLVLARTPYIGELIPYVDFFHTALVIHVDMSVLVWNLAFAGVLWSLVSRASYLVLNKLVLVVLSLATVMMAAAGFLPNANPIMSNYIPVLDNPVFLTGLILFGGGVGVQVLLTMSITPPVGQFISSQGVVRFGLNCAAISLLIALMAFAWSWATLPVELVSEVYYEMLFWGGGHILQYTYTLLMMVCWLWLATTAEIRMIMHERIVMLVFLAGLLSVFVTPLIYLNYEVTHPMHRELFTWLMSFGGSLATFPLGLAVYYGLVQKKPENHRQRAAHSALMTSLMLFACGGVIGFLITGNNVTVPAHYHGCIVGVTLALMGVAYDVLPKLGFANVNFKWANIQLWGYATGQFMHILGLVWSGGYGVERKVAGAAQALDSIERVAGMGLMGLGGLISSLGGLLFIIIVIKALLNPDLKPEIRQTTSESVETGSSST